MRIGTNIQTKKQQRRFVIFNGLCESLETPPRDQIWIVEALSLLRERAIQSMCSVENEISYSVRNLIFFMVIILVNK